MRRLALAVAGFYVSIPLALGGLAAGGSPPAAAHGVTPLARHEIPSSLLAVYRGAAATCPGLAWPVLAAVGWVESRHGGGRADPRTGAVTPPIVGPPLDGRPGTARIADTTSPDGWAHAQGVMQFIPSTWARWATLAPERPPGTVPDPHNAWDAIYTAARYLCANLGDGADGLRQALLAYNRSGAYVTKVLAKATAYGLGNASAADTDDVASSSAATAAVAAAVSQLGVPYVWGGSAPGIGFDCSGLVQWAYGQAGVRLPRTTSQQVLVGRSVALSELRAGDLVFMDRVERARTVAFGHEALYVGGGYIVVAPRTGKVVELQPLNPARVRAVRRVAG